ncbi:MAG: hypothetical protein NVSMB8_03690 [Candidatus Limnocylindrales bacterium]
MRRPILAVALLAILLVPLGLGRTATAESILETTLEFLDTKMDVTLTGTGNADYFIDLSQVNPNFFANHYTVLDAKLSYDLSQVLNKNCPPNLTLIRSDAIHTNGARIRRSSEDNVAVQRVATAQPYDRYFKLQVRRDSTGIATSGPCVTLSNLAVPYTLRVTLYASNPAGTSNYTFTQQRLPVKGDGEPSIAVDRLHGDITYISAPTGGPAALGGNAGGVDFWRSLDGGTTFSYSQPVFGNANGGFDSHVAVAANGDVYLADLAATAIDLGVSHDRGATFSALPIAGVDSDRQWLATYTPAGAPAPTKVFVSYHDINVDNLPYECIVTPTVSQLVCNPMVTDPAVAANATGNTVIGNQVFDSRGTVYSIFGSPSSPTAGAPAPLGTIYLARSADGIAFTDRRVYVAPAGYDTAGIFPIIAIDAADNLYAVWSERRAPYFDATVKLSVSTDHGDTWSAPQALSAPGSALLPWVTAGKAGEVDVVWVGSTATSSNDPTADWYVYMAQSQNALGGKFSVSQTTSQPIRYGSICLSGLGCSTAGDDGRILLDFISVDYDSQYNAAMTFANSGPEGPSDNPRETYTDFAKQRSGTTIGQ